MLDQTAYDSIVSWLLRTTRESPPPPEISAFNVGLFESSAGYKAYLTGAKRFDETDDDWACEADYAPIEKYFKLPVNFVRDKTWDQLLSDLIEILQAFVKSGEFAQSVFIERQALTVGFDDGNLHRIY